MVELLLYLLRNHIYLKKESLLIEITNNESKNIIFNVGYQPPDHDIDLM